MKEPKKFNSWLFRSSHFSKIVTLDQAIAALRRAVRSPQSRFQTVQRLVQETSRNHESVCNPARTPAVEAWFPTGCKPYRRRVDPESCSERETHPFSGAYQQASR